MLVNRNHYRILEGQAGLCLEQLWKRAESNDTTTIRQVLKRDDLLLSLWVGFLYRLNNLRVFLGIVNAQIFTSLTKQHRHYKTKTSKRNNVGGTSYMKYLYNIPWSSGKVTTVKIQDCTILRVRLQAEELSHTRME